MLDLVMAYALLGIALLVPLLLLAGLVWVLIHPLDLQEVNRERHGIHGPEDHREAPTAEPTRDATGGSGRAA